VLRLRAAQWLPWLTAQVHEARLQEAKLQAWLAPSDAVPQHHT